MVLRRMSLLASILVGAGVTVGIFQNCSKAQFLSGAGQMTEESQAELSTCETQDCANIRAGVATCTFDGQTVADGDAVTAFFSSTVPFGGTCFSETRICLNGALTGSFQFGSCTPGLPAACQFNGASVAHGQSVTGFQSSSVVSPGQCVSEQRTCSNGVLSGSFQFESCQVNAPMACQFDGREIPSGSTVIAFQNSSVPAGSSCTQEIRTCTNGVLSGSFSNGSCVVDQPAPCTFNGQTVASGQQVVAFLNSSEPFGQTCQSQARLCTNGSLSGSYTHASCVVGAPASCQFNGQTIAHGQSTFAFLTSTVPYGQTCSRESRVCNNGSLGGSYEFASCNVNAPASCVFNGRTIVSGDSVVAFTASSVPFGSTCASQTRVCTNGQLSGTAEYASCSVAAPKSCLFNGQTVAHGARVQAYRSSSVAFGSTCQTEARVCNDGTLSGSYSYGSCVVDRPQACLFNGRTIPHGGNTVGYAAASVNHPGTCSPQTRVCNNGTLSGTYPFAACAVILPQWVNVANKNETHAQACARVGMRVPASASGLNGQGICASPESQPGPTGGLNWDKIRFPYGIGKYSGRRGGGGQIVARSFFRGGFGYLNCYKPGQKRDSDSTDRVVAYLCSPR